MDIKMFNKSMFVPGFSLNLDNRKIKFLFHSSIVLLFFCACSSSANGQLSNLILLDEEVLNHNKTVLKEGGSSDLKKAYQLLISKADDLLDKGPYSVTYKKASQIPEGGTIHDYYSLAPYWWPDPSKPGGLPYIQRDGRINSSRDSIPDRIMTGNVCSNVNTLGLAYFYSDNEVYAEKAKELIKVFFFDEETKMNPNYNFSQYINGHPSSGGNSISAVSFLDLLDGVGLIESSSSWTSSDDSQLKAWFNDFISWMTDSEKGKREANRTNNIGTYYTVQVVGYLLYVGKADLAKKVFDEQAYTRVDQQIDKEGNMPHELARAKPYNYVSFNTEAFIKLDQLGRKLGVNLWDYEGNNGGSIEKAFEKLNRAALSNTRVSFGRERVNPSSVRLVLSKYSNHVSRRSKQRLSGSDSTTAVRAITASAAASNDVSRSLYLPEASDVRENTYMSRLTGLKY